MAKKDDKRKKDNDKLHRQVIFNWIICGVSFVVIIILRLVAQNQ